MTFKQYLFSATIIISTASSWAMDCKVNPNADGCSIYTKCRKPADVAVQCDSASGFISSSKTIPEFIKVTIMTAGDSRLENGRFVQGNRRDLRPMTFTFKNTKNRTVEDFFYKQDEINQELEKFNFPSGMITSDNLNIQLNSDHPIYSSPQATQVVNQKPEIQSQSSNESGYMFCTWNTAPTIARKKCGGNEGICSGEANCSGNSKFSGAPPKRNLILTCDTASNGQCPTAIECLRAPEPAGHVLQNKCSAQFNRDSFLPSSSSSSSNRANGGTNK